MCVWVCTHTHMHSCIGVFGMGWLWLVGSLKLQVSFTEYRLFYRALWQKRPIISRSQLIVATPYLLKAPAKWIELVQKKKCTFFDTYTIQLVYTLYNIHIIIDFNILINIHINTLPHTVGTYTLTYTLLYTLTYSLIYILILFHIQLVHTLVP